MDLTVMDSYDLLVMKLIHYFIVSENYTPIIIKGIDDEVWLENKYSIIRIVTRNIINKEQYDYDILKTKHIVKQLKRKLIDFSMNVLSIYLDKNFYTNKIDNFDEKYISILIKDEDDFINNEYINKAYKQVIDKFTYKEEGFELISKLTKEIEEKNIKEGQEREKYMKNNKPIITYILMGLTITIGSLNKFTVIIIAIAVGIDLLINRKFKEFAKILVSVVSIMMIFNVTFNLYMYSSHLDRQTAKGENTPYNHWVMMGLKGDGVYNPEDYEFTRKYDYDENRNSKINKEIFDRIKNLGFCGIFDLAMTKSTADFGNGTYGAEDFYNCNPQTDTKLHDWILPEGKNYKKYATYATSMHIAILIFMLTAAWGFVCSDDEKRKKMFSLYLTIFGVYLFLLCWETNRRYFSNFAPVIFICGTLGIDKFIEVCLKTKEKIKCGLK